MSAVRKTLRVGLWLVAAVVATPVVIYLGALAINWRDQPPSPAALAFAAAEPASSPVADENNAYIYLLGFASPRDRDPAAPGIARAAWIRELSNDLSITREADPGPQRLSEIEQLFEPLRELNCAMDSGAPCFAALDRARDTIERVTTDQAWLIERYRRLLSYTAWADVTAEDFRAPYPDHPALQQARRLYLLHTWLLAVAGDADGVRAALDADLEFWRLSLRDSSSLLSKMIAESHCREHFAWGTLILRRLSRESRAGPIPASWGRPLTDEERSLVRAFRGEWKYARNTMRYLPLGGLAVPPGGADTRTLGERVDSALSMPFFKLQATLNEHAAALLRLESLLDVPYAELPAALARVPNAVDEQPSGVIDAAYNVIGRSLIAPGREYWANYGARVADLEGIRRAALLAAELRARDVPLDAVAAAIELNSMRDPYTDQPFQWIPERTAIGFAGLQNQSRGHFEFLY
jgi:hypothetical protein